MKHVTAYIYCAQTRLELVVMDNSHIRAGLSYLAKAGDSLLFHDKWIDKERKWTGKLQKLRQIANATRKRSKSKALRQPSRGCSYSWT